MAFKYIENKDIQRNFVNGISEVEVLPARSERYSIGCHKDLPAGQNSGYLRQVIFTGKTNHRKFIREIFEKEGRT